MQQKDYPFHIYISAKIIAPILKTLDALKDVGDLIVRCWIASIFIESALSKLADFPSTISLFENVYHVPLLPPVFAAYLGTGAELVLSILLILGLGGRFFIFVFFVYNIICVISFNFLWTPNGSSGLNDHINWGLLLMMLMFHGSGRISLDYLIHKRFGHLVKLGAGEKFLWFNK